ncbi:MAG: GNAT family N-acetyltransferase [Pseudomonadota bacterium]
MLKSASVSRGVQANDKTSRPCQDAVSAFGDWAPLEWSLADFMVMVRLYCDGDWPALWRMLRPVFRAGETYACPRDVDEAQTHTYWVGSATACWVAEHNGLVIGSYYVKPNQPGQGSHVSNCGYVVAAEARNRGVAAALCTHSQAEAVRLGFRAMQFNLVASTNSAAVHLWQRLGYHIVGRLPGAFCHPQQGDVDAFVMYKRLVD